MISTIQRLADYLAGLGVLIGALAVALMMIHVCVDVTIRNLVGIPIYGTIEIVSKYMMVFIAFAPLAAIQQRRSHLFVESFTAFLPTRVNAVIDFLAVAYFAGMTGLLLYASGKKAIEKTNVRASIDTPAFEIPVWPTYWIIPLACAALIAVLIGQMLAGPQVVTGHHHNNADEE